MDTLAQTAVALPCRQVTPQEVAHYQEHGWVMLRRFVDPEMLGKVLAIAKGIMGEDGDSNPPYGIDQPYFNAQYGCLHANPEIRPLHLGVGRAAKALMNRKADVGVRLFNDFFAPKLPAERVTKNQGNGPTSFHQDYITFAVDRTEVVLFRLRELVASGAIPSVPVFVDSPMALSALRAYRARGIEAMLVPHHIGYKAGYRGINWAEVKPEFIHLVEIMSMHGASESEIIPNRYLHTMGPLDWQSSLHYGLAQGHMVGVIGSTDHHSAHPGSYGHGRVAVWATALTRDGIWDALTARRTVALTGDRIALQFALNGAPMGALLPPASERRIEVAVSGGGARPARTTPSRGPGPATPSTAKGRFPCARSGPPWTRRV